MNIIETHNLTRRFGRTEAVHDLNLTVPAGRTCALLGANGAGKTTTLKLLMNLVTPSSGTAQIMGTDSRRLGERELAQIGYVSENQMLPLWMTVRQWLDFCRPFYPTWDLDLEKSLLDQFELPTNRLLKQLSRGMLMKASLLSSLAYRPRLLVLDEPFSGLDPLVRDEFVRGVIEVSAQGDWTMLISSHDIEEVERLADQVALLDNGRLKFSEPTEVLQNRFRRVVIAGVVPSNGATADMLEWEQAGQLTRFVTPSYAGETTERVWRERFPNTTITAQPMTLREVFITMARTNRKVTKQGVAA